MTPSLLVGECTELSLNYVPNGQGAMCGFAGHVPDDDNDWNVERAIPCLLDMMIFILCFRSLCEDAIP